jgi:hypothetical protein
MKYLVISMLITLSFNSFTNVFGPEDKNYVVCYERSPYDVAACANEYIDKGYKPLSGLHGTRTAEMSVMFFQALIKN